LIKYLSLFSGIGAFEKSLERHRVPYELVAYCEIDKFASKAYSLIHKVDESMNLGDITKVDEKSLPNDIDLVTYGFPCQDISLAGRQKGLFNEDGSQTRSGLFFEALRIIEHSKPKIAIAENVKNLTAKKFEKQFEIVLENLSQAGYNNYWKVLNAKDYGIPQNRERVFIVSIRQDLDQGLFEFPEPFPLILKLQDFLEDGEVDQKYYVSDDKVKDLIPQLMNKDISNTIRREGDWLIRSSSMGSGHRVGATLSRYATRLTKISDVSDCFLARDFKGFANQDMNGVIEIGKDCNG
jgi:DNA (cytosine-5)-methyltransferase 1